MDEKRYYTSKEAVEYLESWGLHPEPTSLVRKLTKYGKGIKRNRNVLFTMEEIDEYLYAEKDLYTIEEVAAALNISVAFVSRLNNEGMQREMHYGKYYYDIDTVCAFLEHHRKNNWKRNKQ